MTEITKIECPDVDNCGSSDAYCFNTVSRMGHCKSCDGAFWEFKGNLWTKQVGSNSKGRIVKALDDDTSNDDISGGDDMEVVDTSMEQDNSGGYLPLRGINAKVMEKYGVVTVPDVPYQWKHDRNDHKEAWKSGVSTEIRFPVGKSYKVRRLDLDKSDDFHFGTPKGFKSDEFFGQNLFPSGCSKMVVICEGEFDAMSAYQMLSQNSSYVNPVVSLPSATPSGKLWEKSRAWLDSFDKIILSGDNDEVGRKVADTMFDLFPSKLHIMDHGAFKDANDFLVAGKAKDYKSAFWSAKKYSPAGFTASIDDWMDAIDGEDPYEYTPTPIKAYNTVGKGWVKGGLTVVKAPPGTGKSSLLRMSMHDLVVNKGLRVGALMMEEVKSVTGRAMATYSLGKNVKTKEDAEASGVSEDAVKEALTGVVKDERFVSFDINPQDAIEDTLRQCKNAIAVYEVDYIFIDHLQRLAYLSGTEGATAALTELGVKLTELAKRRNVGIICISHVNSDGRTKYASSIEEEAIVLIEMLRDKKSEDLEERNSTYLEITKNRPYALTGPAGVVTYDVETDMVSEKMGVGEPKGKPHRDLDDEIPF